MAHRLEQAWDFLLAISQAASAITSIIGLVWLGIAIVYRTRHKSELRNPVLTRPWWGVGFLFLSSFLAWANLHDRYVSTLYDYERFMRDSLLGSTRPLLTPSFRDTLFLGLENPSDGPWVEMLCNVSVTNNGQPGRVTSIRAWWDAGDRHVEGRLIALLPLDANWLHALEIPGAKKIFELTTADDLWAKVKQKRFERADSEDGYIHVVFPGVKTASHHKVRIEITDNEGATVAREVPVDGGPSTPQQRLARTPAPLERPTPVPPPGYVQHGASR